MRGSGVGPTAVFTYDSLDLGSNYLGALHRYEVELHNRGQVDAAYEILPSDRTVFAQSFGFEPARGLLRPEEKMTITVNFACSRLGDFTERFECAVTGAAAPLHLEFRGSVVGPSFDVILPEGSHDGRHETLDFGTVAYGMLYSRIVVIHNTSEVPMRFAVRCQQGLAPRGLGGHGHAGANANNEFTLTPTEGAIPAGAKQRIKVEFISRTVKRYSDRYIIIDVPGVAKAVKHVALAAECAAPRIALKESGELVFSECFLRHPCRATAVLVNQTRLPARFEVEPQNPASVALGTFTVEPQTATIPPMQECPVVFTLEAERLGPIHLPASIRVLGSSAQPLRLTLSALSQGPNLLLTPSPPPAPGEAPPPPPEDWTPAFSFGKVKVLVEHSVTLHVTNTSPIPAELKLFMDRRDSLFAVNHREVHLGPGESVPLTVSATLDDSLVFSDTLHMLVMEGPEMDVPVEAQGLGSCVTASEPLDAVDFGHQLTLRAFERPVVLSNMGRRPVSLVWANSVQLAREQAAKEQAKQPGGARKKPAAESPPGTADGARADDGAPLIFQVVPNKITLQPRQQCTFHLQGRAENPGAVAETLVCRALLGKAWSNLFEVPVSADLSHPMLEANPPALVFKHQYAPGIFPAVVTRELSLTNVSPLPLAFQLKVAPPFSVEKARMLLDRGETATTAVFFDVASFNSAECNVTKGQLTIHYADHAQRDTVDVTARRISAASQSSSPRFPFSLRPRL